MEPDRWRDIERIYHQALEQAPAVRSAWLSAAANGDPAIEAEVRSLLEQSDESGVFMEEPAFRVAARDLAMSSIASHPTAIGRYRILRLLGEGGMGAVYEAEQAEPRRIVALKVIRLGLATPERFRRFRQESEALARLQHPGIAQVYESGTADTGFGQQPYFAMELIPGGLSLHQYAETRRLDARQKLAIIAQICDAVHHAHQRGLIHRDLKPGNIIVDEMGQPKVLDFGVARVTEAAGQDENAATHTGLGQLVGTLAYMSPEQVLGDPAAIDARSDIYALGVILYRACSPAACPTTSAKLELPRRHRSFSRKIPRRLPPSNEPIAAMWTRLCGGRSRRISSGGISQLPISAPISAATSAMNRSPLGRPAQLINSRNSYDGTAP